MCQTSPVSWHSVQCLPSLLQKARYPMEVLQVVIPGSSATILIEQLISVASTTTKSTQFLELWQARSQQGDVIVVMHQYYAYYPKARRIYPFLLSAEVVCQRCQQLVDQVLGWIPVEAPQEFGCLIPLPDIGACHLHCCVAIQSSPLRCLLASPVWMVRLHRLPCLLRRQHNPLSLPPSSKPSLSGAPSLSRPPRASATGVVLSPCPFSSLNPCLSSLNYGGIPNVVLSLLSPHTCPPSCPCYSLFRGSQVSSRFLWLPWLLLAYYHTITIVLYYCHIQH